MNNDISPLELHRRKMHKELCELLGSKNVYFNPLSGMKYPCIRYTTSSVDTKFADNVAYKNKPCWTLTLIEHDVTSDLYLRIMSHFQYCTFVQKYNADNLHHTVLRLFY